MSERCSDIEIGFVVHPCGHPALCRRGPPASYAPRGVAKYLDCAICEVERLRNVIKTGGAVYRAERSVMGIPGGHDPNQHEERETVGWRVRVVGYTATSDRYAVRDESNGDGWEVTLPGELPTPTSREDAVKLIAMCRKWAKRLVQADWTFRLIRVTRRRGGGG